MALMPMTTIKPNPTDSQLEQTFWASLEQFKLAQSLPKTLLEKQQQTVQKLVATGMPTRKNEAWKYIQLQPLLSSKLTFNTKPPVLTDAQLAPFLLQNTTAHRLVYVDGVFSHQHSQILDLPPGAIIADRMTVLENNPSLLEKLDTVLPVFSSEVESPFALMAQLMATSGVVVYLPKKTTLKNSIQIIHISTGTISAEPVWSNLRELIVLEEGAQASVFHQVISLQEQSLNQQLASAQTFTNISRQIQIGQAAELQWTDLQAESLKSWHFSETLAQLAGESNLNFQTVVLGGLVSRYSIIPAFEGQHANCTLNGLNVLKGHSEAYHHTVLKHNQPNNHSDQLYKGILDNQTKAEFDGTVVVAKGAIGTDSQQLNKNLLLSENARCFTRPQLQIQADDVKCAHGATVGQLEPEQLFYFASRGLDKELAECLLTFGFAEDVIARIKHPAVVAYLNNLLLRQLDHVQNPLQCNTDCNTCDV